MDKFYIEYGKFVIHFEKICYNLNFCTRIICTSDKLFSTEDKNIEILLQGLTAYPILTKFYNLIISKEIGKSKELLELVSLFQNRFIKIIEYRNIFSHGTFFYGDPFGNTEKFQVRNPKLNKKGFHDNSQTINIESFISLNNSVIELEEFSSDLIYFLKSSDGVFKMKVLQIMKSRVENLDINLKFDAVSIQFPPSPL